MQKLYILVLCATYATLTQQFKAGVTYTEDEVAKVKDAQNEEGESYFAEVDQSATTSEGDDASDSTPEAGRRISIGKKTATKSVTV